MKESKLKKEIAAWKIMMDSRNNPGVNTFIVLVFILDTVCFLLVCLKRLCQYKNVFPAYPVCAWLFSMVSCNAFFFRMFFNRTSPCFVKTLPFSKSIYTTKLSFLFESIHTLFIFIIMAGSFICFGKGYNSSMFYLVIIFFLFIYFTISIMFPLTAKFFNNENKIYFSNFRGRISIQVLNWSSFFVFQILPMILVSFFAKPLADLFEPLSLHGLTIMAGVALVVMITSWVLNYFMFKKAYERR